MKISSFGGWILSMLLISASCGICDEGGLDMPSEAEVRAAVTIVLGRMKFERRQVLAGKMSCRDAAVRALEFSREAVTSAERFLLVKGAIMLYVKAEDFKGAETAYYELTRGIKNIPPLILANILNRALEGVASEKVQRLAALVDKNISLDRIRKLEDKLLRDPENVLLRRRLAENLVVIGDWNSALENFAKSGGEFSRSARMELSGGDVDWKDLGDFWWLASDDKPGLLYEGYREHARFLYNRKSNKKRTSMPAEGLKLDK